MAICIAVSAEAQESVPLPSGAMPSTVHRHLGFALRLDAGIGYLSSSTSTAGASRDGASGSLGLLIGGAVAENVILAGDIWGTAMLSGSSMMSQSSEMSYGLGGIGLNLTYYFMPTNIYLSASPSLTFITSMRHDGNTADRSNAGIGIKLAVGKEWWVGDHWGLGVAGQLVVSRNDGPTGSKFTSLGGGVAFSATYN